MKKLLLTLFILLISVATAFALAPSAGTVTSFSDTKMGDTGMHLFQVSYTTHASAGTFTCATDRDITGWIVIVETDPGATAPTDNYDITLVNGNSRDIMGGSLANRDTANTEAALPLQNGTYTPVFNDGPLTITVTNAGNSKTAEILIYYMP